MAAVSAIVIDTNNRIIIGGDFTSYDGNIVPTPNIARLTPSGALDTSFSTGLGFNSSVYALAIDANGNILVGGDFTSYNTTNCNHTQRVLPNGALGHDFSSRHRQRPRPTLGPITLMAVTADTSRNVIFCGEFSYVNGSNARIIWRDCCPTARWIPTLFPM